jgi:excisionase family DNA binding protein
MSEKRRSLPVEQTVWLSVEEAAVRLGLCRWTVLRWAKDGDPRLPGYKVWDEIAGNQGRFRFKSQDVEALVGTVSDPAPANLAGSPAPVDPPAGGKRAVKR